MYLQLASSRQTSDQGQLLLVRMPHWMCTWQAGRHSYTCRSGALRLYRLITATVDVKAIGGHGADALLAAAKSAGCGDGGKLRVLTHCNTGALATAAYGTALGVVRGLAERGALEHAYCTETRPYNQGAHCREQGQEISWQEKKCT